jgi:hypothetical protein
MIVNPNSPPGPGGECCAGCVYFGQPPGYPDPNIGVCLRYPPDNDTRYPWVDIYHWCGEHRPGPEVAPQPAEPTGFRATLARVFESDTNKE